MSGTQPAVSRLYQQALASFQRGLAQRRVDQVQAAERFCREALSLAPQHADSLNLLGEIAGQWGRYEDALRLIGEAARRNPNEARYHYNFGTFLAHAGRIEESAKHLRRAVQLRPDYPAAHSNLASALLKRGEAEPALESSRAALRYDPDYAQAHLTMGNALCMLGRPDEAVASYCVAFRLNPGLKTLRPSLRGALRDAGRYAALEGIARETLRLNPQDMEAQYALAYVLLLTGQYAEGWRAFEARRHLAGNRAVNFVHPVWDGTPSDRLRLLLYSEEGFGDTLQFCRFAPLLAGRIHTVFAVSKGLERLLRGLPGVTRIVTAGDAMPECDVQLPLLSAPLLLGTTPETIPATVPYLHADPGLAAVWRSRLQALPGLRVGLAWGGNPDHMHDRRRSIGLDRLAPLADVPGVSFVSLQKGAASSQARMLPPGMALHDWTDELGDFADTAALVAGLDVVVSVDTSVVHLAGALGKPVWLLNRCDTDWRWLLEREDSPWYPTLRQFRQPRLGDWDAVVQAVRTALRGVTMEGAPLVPAVREAESPGATAYGHDGGAGSGTVQAIHDLFQHAVADHMAGRLEQAEQAYRWIVAVTPDHADCQHFLGVLLHQAGRSDEAVPAIERAIALQPDAMPCRNNLGNILRDTGHAEAACACYREALSRQPDVPDLHHNLGKALVLLDATTEAEAAFRRALQLRPDDFDACNDLGNLLTQTGRAEEALGLFDKALSLQPQSATARNNMGLALSELGRHEEAMAALRMAVQIEPGYAKAWFNLAKAATLLRQWPFVLATYQEALRLAPDDAEAHVGYGSALLLTGRLREGWPEMDWMARIEDRRIYDPVVRFPARTWNGEAIGATLLVVYADQGLGDTIHFFRYLPLCIPRARVVFVVQPALAPLLAQAGVVTVLQDAFDLPDSYVHCPVCALPAVFETALDTIPGSVPYLWADAAKVAQWRERLAPLAGLRVGLVWAGNPKYPSDRARSMTLAHFAPLADLPGVTLVSLQKGPAAEQIATCRASLPVHDWMDEVKDFTDTAALVEALDLVIGVDTSVVHLAGAMGKPVWLLNRFDTDWRWLLDRDDSPWYPTLRQFRQTRADDWEGPMTQLRAALASLAAEAHTATLPELSVNA